MSAKYDRRVELAHERGFDSPYQQDMWIKHVREDYEGMEGTPFDQALIIAEYENSYEVGSKDRGDEGDGRDDTLAAWWEANVGDIDWEDPDDPFWDFLDSLSGEASEGA